MKQFYSIVFIGLVCIGLLTVIPDSVGASVVGDNGIGATLYEVATANRWIGGKFTMGSFDGEVNSISAYLMLDQSGTDLKFQIYDNSGNKVTNGYGTIDVGTDIEEGWKTYTFSTKPTLTKNSDYYFTVMAMNYLESWFCYYDTSGGFGVTYKAGALWNPPATWTSVTTIDADGSLSIYCDYTEIVTNPNPPSSFTVDAVGGSDSSLIASWSKGTGADYTRVQYKTGSNPSSISDGTNAYNGTGTSVTVNSLSSGTTYYFCGWSWNTTNSLWSLTSSCDSDTTYTRPSLPSNVSYADNNDLNYAYDYHCIIWSGVVSGLYVRVQTKSGGYPSSISDGTNLCNTTDNCIINTDMTKKMYSLWVYNATSKLWSSSFITWSMVRNLPDYDVEFDFTEIVLDSSSYSWNVSDDWFYIYLVAHGTGSGGCEDLTEHLNLVNVTGTFEHSGCDVYLNYTGNTTPLTHYENIVDATGTHQHILTPSGYVIWANYTGSGGGCSGIVWVNYTDENLTFNVSVDKSDDTNTSAYEINDNNWLLMAGFSFEDDTLGIFVVIALFCIALFSAGETGSIWRPILLFLDVPIALATGISYLGSDLFSVVWWVGIIMFVFAILLAFGGLYYSLSFGRSNKRSQ